MDHRPYPHQKAGKEKKIISGILGVGIGLFLVSSLAWAQQSGQVNISAEVLPQSPMGGSSVPSSYRNHEYYSASGQGGAAFRETTVTFEGRGCPLCKVSILKDGQMGLTTTADSWGGFETSFSGPAASGQFMASAIQEDSAGRRSGLLTFPITITGGMVNEISNFIIPPTLSLDKTEVVSGEILVLSGQSVPREEAELSMTPTPFIIKVQTDGEGNYLYRLDTKGLTAGNYIVMAKTVTSHGTTALPFRVNAAILSTPTDTSTKKESKKELPKLKPLRQKEASRVSLKKAAPCLKTDFNCDQKVNLADFSMLRTWYKVPTPPFAFDLNEDGTIDLGDFSILAYYWTG